MYILKLRDMMSSTSISHVIYGFISIAVMILALLMLGEVGCRIYNFFTPEPALHPIYHINQYDKELGWRNKSDYLLIDTIYEDDGTPVPLRHETDAFGFRTSGDQQADSPRIFILGDSYTQALEVPNGKTYADVIRDSLKASVYAYGSGGYGTLQELMILENHIDRIQPDWVILQFCTNDFVDNHLPLGRKCFGYRIGKCRPYQTLSGELIYQNQDLPMQIKTYTHLGHFLALRWHLFQEKYELLEPDAAEMMTSQGRGYPPYNESIQVTARLLDSLQKRLPPQTRLLAFCSDAWNPYLKDFQYICDSLGISYLSQVPHAIQEAKQRGESVHAADRWHWNAAGHRLVANLLIEAIQPSED